MTTLKNNVITVSENSSHPALLSTPQAHYNQSTPTSRSRSQFYNTVAASVWECGKLLCKLTFIVLASCQIST